jgi:hypothetical protein
MKVHDFLALAEHLQDAGYDGDWIDDRLIESIPFDALGFSVHKLMKRDSEQLYLELDFDISRGGIQLEKLTGYLLNAPVNEEQLHELNRENLENKWQAERVEYKELVPAYFLFDTLSALREMTKDYPELTLKTITMNRNNAESLRAEMTALKVPPALIAEAERLMEKGIPKIEVKGQLPVEKGQMDISLHLRQSGQSDYYYFNKFNLAFSKAKPLENEQKYLVITPNEPGKKPDNFVQKFDSPVEAIDYFKSQTGKSELAVGIYNDKDLQFKTTLATMKDGKVDYVVKEFQKDYYSPALTNSFYVDKGAGFSVVQGANLLQGRSAYREDLVNRAGEQYKAWSVFLFDKPKDKYGNYQVKQFSEGYGYDLKNVLDEYRVKLDADPKKQEQLFTELKDGNRPVVIAEGKDGKDLKVRIEAVPRYGNLNFYQVNNGAPEKREDFLKAPKLEKDLSKSKGPEKEKAESHEIGLLN